MLNRFRICVLNKFYGSANFGLSVKLIVLPCLIAADLGKDKNSI